jgi:hypothetical protein
MDLNAILDQLRQEREQIEEAILSLERMQRGAGKRRGRPPAWLLKTKTTIADAEAVVRRKQKQKHPDAK